MRFEIGSDRYLRARLDDEAVFGCRCARGRQSQAWHTRIQTAPGRLTIGNRTIGDAQPHGMLTVEEVVGAIEQRRHREDRARPAGADAVGYVHQRRLRPGAAARFPGAVTGRLRPAKTWRPIEQATISYGHGVSVTLIQLARAYSVFASDGWLIPLTLLKADTTAMPVRAMSADTARAMRKMLEMAVGPEGTAPPRAFPRTESPARRYRVQDQERPVREGIRGFLRRLCAGVGPAHRRRRNDRRARRSTLRGSGGGTGVRGDYRECIAHVAGFAGRTARTEPRNDCVAESSVSGGATQHESAATEALGWLRQIAPSVFADRRDLHLDSRRLKRGDVFVAVRGERVDGRHDLPAAAASGAAAALVEAEGWDPKDFGGARVPDARR